MNGADGGWSGGGTGLDWGCWRMLSAAPDPGGWPASRVEPLRRGFGVRVGPWKGRSEGRGPGGKAQVIEDRPDRPMGATSRTHWATGRSGRTDAPGVAERTSVKREPGRPSEAVPLVRADRAVPGGRRDRDHATCPVVPRGRSGCGAERQARGDGGSEPGGSWAEGPGRPAFPAAPAAQRSCGWSRPASDA